MSQLIQARCSLAAWASQDWPNLIGRCCAFVGVAHLELAPPGGWLEVRRPHPAPSSLLAADPPCLAFGLKLILKRSVPRMTRWHGLQTLNIFTIVNSW